MNCLLIITQERTFAFLFENDISDALISSLNCFELNKMMCEYQFSLSMIKLSDFEQSDCMTIKHGFIELKIIEL